MTDLRWDSDVRVQQFPNTEIADTKEFTWEIRDWSLLEEREVSEPFECGGYLFEILLFPHGNPASPRKGTISLYLNALGPKEEYLKTDSEETTKPWHVCASFAMTMYNPEHPFTLVTQSTNHRFSPRVTDWGYLEYTSLRSAFVTSPNKSAPLIGPLTPDRRLGVNIRVDLNVLKDPTGILWHDFQDYDSREVTGYTGLVNQGATCYLNSLLQSLYFTGAFRQAVYQIPDSSGVTGGLQRLFYRLSTSQPAVDTTDLTKAFGWDSADAFTQHDVQELARVLMDRLESKMKGTAVDGFLSKLFVGQMKSYIKCINVPFESSRVEDFWDIQLNVKNLPDVTASFREYCASEMLTGDNQYAAGKYGLQDAQKGVTFQSLPPVLHLQLKRYDYDWMHDIEVKINDRFEFPLHLDLSEFVESNEKQPDLKWQYNLHGVLVHSGELNAGHYYALLKPESDGEWFRFDDDRVTRASLHEVLEENFGGKGQGNLLRNASAYMLVYIRSDSLDFVLPSDQKIPSPEIASKIETAMKAEELERKKREEKLQYGTLRILSTETFRRHHGLGILPSLDHYEQSEEPELINIRFTTPLLALSKQLNSASLWLAPPNLTILNTRACSRKLQSIPLQQNYVVKNVSEWVDHQNPIVLAGPEAPPALTVHDHRMVFLKRFENNELLATGIVWIKIKGSKLRDELKMKNDEFLYLEKSTPTRRDLENLLVRLDSDKSGEEESIESSEILIITQDSTGIEKYFDTLTNRVTLSLIPLEDISATNAENGTPGSILDEMLASPPSSDLQSLGSRENSKQPENSTVIDIRQSYESIMRQIGEVLDTDPNKLQLRSVSNRYRRSTIILSTGKNIGDLWRHSMGNVVPVVYRKLPVPLVNFESMIELSVDWYTQGLMGPANLKMLIATREYSAKSALAQLLGLSTDKFIMWVGQLNRRTSEIDTNITAHDLASRGNQGLDIFAAPLLPDELNARRGQKKRFVTCFHFHKDPSRAHSVPFQLALIPKEPFSSTKRRIFNILKTNQGDEVDKSLEKIRFSVVRDRGCDAVYITDDELVAYDTLPQLSSIGLDHPGPHRVTSHYQQQAIHID